MHIVSLMSNRTHKTLITFYVHLFCIVLWRLTNVLGNKVANSGGGGGNDGINDGDVDIDNSSDGDERKRKKMNARYTQNTHTAATATTTTTNKDTTVKIAVVFLTDIYTYKVIHEMNNEASLLPHTNTHSTHNGIL